MVVLAVTWMAKAGHDGDVVLIFSKLTEESRASHFLQYARKDLPKVADRVEGNLFEPLG